MIHPYVGGVLSWFFMMDTPNDGLRNQKRTCNKDK